MLLGCFGLNNLVTSLGKNTLYCMCCLSLCLTSRVHDRKSAVLESVVGIKSGNNYNNKGPMFLATDLQVSILCAVMGEQNDLTNDGREGPFRTRWISLLGTLSKRQ